MRDPFDPLDPRVQAISMLEQHQWKLEVDQVRKGSDPGVADELQATRGIWLALIGRRPASPLDLEKLSREFRSQITHRYPDIDPFRRGLGFGPFWS